MMEDNSRKDIRALLKTFGVQADEAIVQHLARNPATRRLKLKVSLQDQTDYGGSQPDSVLTLEVQGEINR